ncbi:peptidase inhibitor family I36 protein [Streptomyces sp. NPDC048564]|uniref:Peptidase inhibitor family I36 protein n=1 Tax=Streptomyces sp. NBC_00180 TaxID=2903632 RepID=A0AAU1HRC7_9ACTN|nr:peptidase inhibitor family I36 protein [Streptomyces sp. NBC_01017]
MRAGVGVAALLMTAATGVASAPSASAAVADCPRGYVCVWNNDVAWGEPTWKSTGNLYDLHSEHGMYIVNNGVPYPGADHIRFSVTAPGGNFQGCLHYPNDPNTDNFVGPVTLHSAVWGGEC